MDVTTRVLAKELFGSRAAGMISHKKQVSL